MSKVGEPEAIRNMLATGKAVRLVEFQLPDRQQQGQAE